MPGPTSGRTQRCHFHSAGATVPDQLNLSADCFGIPAQEVDEKALSSEKNVDWPIPIRDFADLIETDLELKRLAMSMFDEVPRRDPYAQDPVGNKQVRNYKHMLDLFAAILNGGGPRWNIAEYQGGLLGFPFNAILNWPMGTQSGYAFFLHPRVNRHLHIILDTWRDSVLMTEKSLGVITTGQGGWLSEEALAVIESDTNIDGTQWLKFEELFKCDPQRDPVHWGFQSWDDFFVREFKSIDRLRPVAHRNDPRWVVNSCEAMPYSLQSNVKEQDEYWLKGQPYSVSNMLNMHPTAAQFAGGTIYQAFLSATSYHRWNSPVGGRVIYAEVINGTYFSASPSTGFSNSNGPDPAAPNQAQRYITQVATRAMFLIDAEGPIGLMAVIYVGMADVSTCEIKERFRLNLPQLVTKGEEIGMFHYGGSTYCLLFRKGLKLDWVPASCPDTARRNLPIRGELVYAAEDL